MVHQNTISFIKKEDIVRTNIHWRFESSLWPSPWAQQSKMATQHSGSWWCTTIPSLVAKGSELQEIRKKQSFLFLAFEPALWPRPWRLEPNLFAYQVSLWLHMQFSALADIFRQGRDKTNCNTGNPPVQVSYLCQHTADLFLAVLYKYVFLYFVL